MLFVNAHGIEVPRLGFGTWKLQDAECVEAVTSALSAGYRHLDTAQAYHNEEQVGEGMRASGVARQDIFLVTKIWRDKMQEGELQASLDASLRKLGTDYVDLLLIHWPVAEVPLEETLRALDAARQAGKARLIGVSNFTVSLLREAEKILPGQLACNQVEYHPFLSQAPLMDWMKQHSMFLTAYSPLARGKLSDVPELMDMAETHGRTIEQIALRWFMQQASVVAIPKASSRKHQLANLAIFDFSLSDAEMEIINHLARPDGRFINPSWAPTWDAA